MLKLRYYCPVCDKECKDPTELRDHRIAAHKGIYQPSYINSKVAFLAK